MAASTALITDMTTVTTTTPTAATVIKQNAAAGPIQDVVGNAFVSLAELKGLKERITEMVAATDSSDPNYTTLNNILLTLT